MLHLGHSPSLWQGRPRPTRFLALGPGLPLLYQIVNFGAASSNLTIPQQPFAASPNGFAFGAQPSSVPETSAGRWGARGAIPQSMQPSGFQFGQQVTLLRCQVVTGGDPKIALGMVWMLENVKTCTPKARRAELQSWHLGISLLGMALLGQAPGVDSAGVAAGAIMAGVQDNAAKAARRVVRAKRPSRR